MSLVGHGGADKSTHSDVNKERGKIVQDWYNKHEPKNGEYRGLRASFTYQPSEDEDYVKYDWLVLQVFNGKGSVKSKYAMDEGPWYNSADGGGTQALINALYAYKETPNMKYSAAATVFGFLKDGTAIQLATVMLGFTYNDGELTLIQPTITYKK